MSSLQCSPTGYATTGVGATGCRTADLARKSRNACASELRRCLIMSADPKTTPRKRSLFASRVERQEEGKGRAIPARALGAADAEFAVMTVHDFVAHP